MKSKLTDRQKKIYRLHRDRYTMVEIAEMLGVTKQYVAKTLDRLETMGYKIRRRRFKKLSTG